MSGGVTVSGGFTALASCVSELTGMPSQGDHVSDSSGMPVSSALVESSVNHQNQQNTVTLQSSSPTGELVTAGESGKEANLEGLEFDGDTVLCRVCGDKASGFHYGVHACEGCKGFFRRSIQQKIQYRPCLKNQQCGITRVNRNRCQYCRLKKCIAVGMSRDAVRFGRVPKREKDKIQRKIQELNAQAHVVRLDSVLENEVDVIQRIIEGHISTCQYTYAKLTPLREKAWKQPEFINCPASMACPLNPRPESCSQTDGDDTWWTEFSSCITPVIEGVATFAKSIPGFKMFTHEDQLTLLRSGIFEVLLVQLSCLFDCKTNTMMFSSGKLYKRVNMSVTNSAGFLLDSMFDFSERMNELQLTDEEIALFSALVIITSDRPGLRNVEHIERVQGKITRGLQVLMKSNHPENPSLFTMLLTKIPDLRTLNALHSEKLEGMTVQQNEGTDTCPNQRKMIPSNNPLCSFLPNGMVLNPAGQFPPQPAMMPPMMFPSGQSENTPPEGVPVVPHQMAAMDKHQELVLQMPIGSFHRIPAGMKPEPLESQRTLPQDFRPGDVQMSGSNYSSPTITPVPTPGTRSALTSRSATPEPLDYDPSQQNSHLGEDVRNRSPLNGQIQEKARMLEQIYPDYFKKRPLDPMYDDSELKAQKMSEDGMRSFRSNSVGGSCKFGIRPRSDSWGTNTWDHGNGGSNPRSRSNSLSTRFEKGLKIRASNAAAMARSHSGANMDAEQQQSRSGSFSGLEYDLRSQRSDSISSSASLESGDSGYRTNPPTPRTAAFDMRVPYNIASDPQARMDSCPVSKAAAMAIAATTRESDIGKIPEECEDHHVEGSHGSPRKSASLSGPSHQSNFSRENIQCVLRNDNVPDSEQYKFYKKLKSQLGSGHTGMPGARDPGFVMSGSGSHVGHVPMVEVTDMSRTGPPPVRDPAKAAIAASRAQQMQASDWGLKRPAPWFHGQSGGPVERRNSAPSMHPGAMRAAQGREGEMENRLVSPRHTVSCLKDKLLQRIGSRENLFEGDSHEEKSGDLGANVTHPVLPPGDLGANVTHPVLPPHSAYNSVPYTSMHPAYLYQYAAMQQYQALHNMQRSGGQAQPHAQTSNQPQYRGMPSATTGYSKPHETQLPTATQAMVAMATHQVMNDGDVKTTTQPMNVDEHHTGMDVQCASQHPQSQHTRTQSAQGQENDVLPLNLTTRCPSQSISVKDEPRA